jgi:hypothetical protein
MLSFVHILMLREEVAQSKKEGKHEEEDDT